VLIESSIKTNVKMLHDNTELFAKKKITTLCVKRISLMGSTIISCCENYWGANRKNKKRRKKNGKSNYKFSHAEN
jgi:hypothetical protein